jgi:hypothetical protein
MKISLEREVTAFFLGNYTLLYNFMTYFPAKITAISNNAVISVGVNSFKTEK